MKKTVEFYFDIVSPYSYLASKRIENIATNCQAELIWRPFLLGGVFKAVNNQPPAMLPARGKSMLKDLHRNSKFYGIPFAMPKNFPGNSLLAMRVLAGLVDNEIPVMAHKLYQAYWVDGQDISDATVVEKLVGADLIELANSTDVKEKLKQTTSEAVKRGAYGAPSIFVDDQLFFGHDRLMFVEAYLQGKL